MAILSACANAAASIYFHYKEAQAWRWEHANVNICGFHTKGDSDIRDNAKYTSCVTAILQKPRSYNQWCVLEGLDPAYPGWADMILLCNFTEEESIQVKHCPL